MRSLVLLAALVTTTPLLAQPVQLPAIPDPAVQSGPAPLPMHSQQQANAEAYPATAAGSLPQSPLGQGSGFPTPPPQQQPAFQPPSAAATPPSTLEGQPSAVQQRVDALRSQLEQKYGQLDNAQPFLSGNQLQQMQKRQLRIRETLMLGAEAKALADLNKQLEEIEKGDGGKGGVSERSEEEVKRRIDEAVAQALAAKKAEEEAAPKPVIASIHGSGGSLRAIVLVPYSGQFTVRAGSGLPGGMRVVSLSGNGVEVVQDGKRFPLAFGVAVPSVRPPSAVAAAAGGRTVSMPIGANPLPMGGGLGGR